MPDDAVARNRLDQTASPYLLDHADNPVHWQPWDDIALQSARERDVPIFLSIGYAACHWCHVMADESFEDAAVASRLNEDYVPIKVDREEHPDLDQFYQTAIQVTVGGGGWPLSAWLTPDGRPFQLATYLPKRSQSGRMGFIEVLDQIADQWQTNRDDIEERADEITAAIRTANEPQSTASPTDTGEELLQGVANNLLRAIDHDNGGFQSQGPKFPHPLRLEVLLRAWETSGRDAYRSALARTLDAMNEGGLHDHVGGGFHRYVTDPEWKVPHFEKMLYDNASLLGVFAEAAARLKADRYAATARDTARFMRESLRDESDGFCSSLDADAGGEEGATYVWSPEQLEDAIDESRTRSVVADRFGITTEREVAGGTVLRIDRSLEELTDTYELSHDEVVELLEDGLDQLRQARADRPQPRCDSKVITAWNGLAISGFARAGVFLDEPEYLDTARSTLAFVESSLYEQETGQLWRRYRDGDVAIPGFLSDYAAAAVGAFDLHWATGSRDAARFGLDLVDELLDRCWDPTEQSLHFSQRGEGRTPVETLDARDRSTPSPIALTLDALATASGFVDDERISTVVEAIRSTYGGSNLAGRIDQAGLALAVDRWRNGPPSATIVGDEIPTDWRHRLHHHPRRVLITHRPKPADLEAATETLGLEEIPPLWRDRTPLEGQTAIYACQGRTCGPPMTDIDEALSWLSSDPTTHRSDDEVSFG